MTVFIPSTTHYEPSFWFSGVIYTIFEEINKSIHQLLQSLTYIAGKERKWKNTVLEHYTVTEYY